MLKITNKTSFKSFVALHLPVAYGFAPYNKRNFVPKLMKDPKFTKEGIFKPRKKNLQYDLDQPHVLHPERYYNHAVDQTLERQAYRQRRAERRGFEEPVGKRELASILEDMTNVTLLTEGSSRFIKCIDEIETHYAEQLKTDDTLRNIIVRAVKSMNTHLHLKNFREFAILTVLNRKYELWEPELWTKIKYNFMKYFRREENDSIQLVNHKVNEKNFAIVLSSIIFVSKKNGLKIQDLIEDIESQFLPRIEGFSVPNLILFTNALTALPSLKGGPVWKKIEAIVAPQIKDINVLDAITLINTFAKAQVVPSFLDQLIDKFVTTYPEITKGKMEKISVVALSLANLKARADKFNVLAEKEVEANLQDLTHLLDIQFIICGFGRLGIRNKRIYEHCAKVILSNFNRLQYRDIEPYLKSILPTNLLPQEFFIGLSSRLERLLEENPLFFDKVRTATILHGLESWRGKGLVDCEETISKFKLHSQYSGFVKYNPNQTQAQAQSV